MEMSWKCVYCGWTNEHDERVGREEPICIRCKERRVNGEDVLNDLTNQQHDLEELRDELTNGIARREARIGVLTVEIKDLKKEIEKMDTERQDCEESIAAIMDRKKAIRDNINTKRCITPDQNELSRWLRCGGA